MLKNVVVQKSERKIIRVPHLLLFFKIFRFSATVVNFECGGLTQLLTLEEAEMGTSTFPRSIAVGLRAGV